MFSEQQIRETALQDNPASRQAFLAKHKSQTNKVIGQLVIFYRDFGEATKSWPRQPRYVTVAQFLHVAGNSLATSLNLLVAGLIVPSGNLVRQYAEAMSMAMLCSVPSVGVFDAFNANRATYAVHKSVDRVLKKENARALRESLGLDAESWKIFKKSASVFDAHSHSTILAIGSSLRFGKKSAAMILGPEYDPKKFKFYRIELLRRFNGAATLVNVFRAIDATVPRNNAA